jgi:hypothetical protein
MISLDLANAVLLASLAISTGAYIQVSRSEGSYVNIMTPGFLVNVPAMYLLPIAFNSLFGAEASPFAYVYVYATIAAENLIFAFVYTRPKTKPLCLPLAFGYSNFWGLSLLCLAGAGLLYLPILLEFREYIFDPRRIYELTRTGFGTSFFLSSTLVYLAVILVLFAKQSVRRRVFVFLGAGFLLSLHGSKGQVLQLFFLILIFEIYVKRRRLTVLPALAVCFGISMVLLGLFAATMTLETPADALQSLSQYSDYTRNAMLVIDSNFPLQYGRLTWESNVLAFVPRALFPSKPKDFGAFYLDAEFFPHAMDEDRGAPAFGPGLQYADFGILAIVYLGLFAALRGWLARLWVDRLKHTWHPSDFLVVAFLADVVVFPIGTGWLLPETLLVATFLRYVSCFGAPKIYHEQVRRRGSALPRGGSEPVGGLEGI